MVRVEFAAFLAHLERCRGTGPSLNLASQRLDSVRLRFLLEYLQRSPFPPWRSLELSNCSIGPSGLQPLAKALNLNRNIESIDLRQNPLSADGGIGLKRFACRLEHCYGALKIELAEDDIVDAAVVALSELIRRKPSITIAGVDLSRDRVHAAWPAHFGLAEEDVPHPIRTTHRGRALRSMHAPTA